VFPRKVARDLRSVMRHKSELKYNNDPCLMYTV